MATRRKIVRGSDAIIPIRLKSARTGDPIQLGSASEVEVELENDDGTCQDYLMTTGGVSIVNASAGMIQVNLPASGSSTLKTSDEEAETPYPGVVVKYTIDGKLEIVNISQCLDIVDPIILC